MTMGSSPCSTRVLCRWMHLSSAVAKKANLKGKNVTAQKWLVRQIRDPYVKKAQYTSYRCRSAFKLIEIDDKHKILHPGNVVIDCGAAPGSWSQVAVERVNALGTELGRPVGQVISVDLQHMLPVEGATTLHQSDFTAVDTQTKILELLAGRSADSVISDMAPNATGVKSMDHDIIVRLCFKALKFSLSVLGAKGTFLCKLWQGSNQGRLEEAIGSHFEHVKVVKPKASRSDSAEIFILARDLKQ